MNPPEQSLEVLGKLRPASVARVHRDEDANGWTKAHILSHEVKPLLLISDGVLDAFDLNTQRHDFVTVVQIKNAPICQ